MQSTNTHPTYDTIVIGAGIIGMLSALELADAGQTVLLIDRGEAGQEASWAGGGILSPLHPWRYAAPVYALAEWSQRYYPDLIQRIHQVSGIDPEYERSGLLILSGDDIDESSRWCKRHAIFQRRVSPAQVAQLDPQVFAAGEGLLLADIGQVRNSRLVRALRECMVLNERIVLLENTCVEALKQHQNRVCKVVTNRDEFVVERVVVCAGAWTGKILQALGTPVGVEPVKGQMLLFNPPEPFLKSIVLDDHHYLIPRRDGRILAGSTMEHVGFDKRTSQSAYEALHDYAVTRIPVLHAADIECQWAGFRPSSPQGIPYIAEHPTIAGLFVNAGQFRNGVVSAPASARLLADLVLQRQPILNPSSYGLLRDLAHSHASRY